MLKLLCKGNCGNEAKYAGWCKIKWKSGNKIGIACPNIEKKRGESISKFRLEEAKEGKNPMQNPTVCAKNHSRERNKKCSEIFKKRGEKGVLPQQIESERLKEKRKNNVSLSLKRLWEQGKHPRQLESYEKRRERIDKMTRTLIALGKEGKLPVQNMTQEEKRRFGEKISKKILEGLKSGRIKLAIGWKKVPYKHLFLRSNWEKVVAESLDKNGIKWEYETKRIDYFDSERKRESITIPDFYIPRLNLIIEVKSNAEFNSQKTKDKMSAIKKGGYNTLLIGRKGIDLIKKDKFQEVIAMQR